MTDETLEQKVLTYHTLDKQEKDAKKQKEPLNKEIKSMMKEAGVDTVVAGAVKAVYGVQERTTLNSAKLLEKLKAGGYTDLIQTVEVPNEKAIEDAIYNQRLAPSFLADCIDKSLVETLTVKKA